MHTTQQLLDTAKAQNSLQSDYKLGIVLGLASDSAITNYRKGRSYPDDDVARKLAELAHLDPGYVLACIHAERAKNDETRALWARIANTLQATGTTAAAVILSSAFFASPDAGGQAKAVDSTLAPTHVSKGAGIYIVAS